MTKAEQEKCLQEFEWLAKFWGRRYGRTPAECAEFTQEGRIAIWAAISAWREDGGASFRSFATRRVRGQILAALQRRNASHTRNVHIDDPVNESFLPVIEPTQDETSSPHWAQQRLEEPLKRLNYIERSVINGRLADLTLDEIGASLQMVREGVRMRELTALRKLKALVKPDYDEPSSNDILHRMTDSPRRRRKSS